MEEGARKGKAARAYRSECGHRVGKKLPRDGVSGGQEASKSALWGACTVLGVLLLLGVILLLLCSIFASPKQRCLRTSSSWARHQDTWV